jgi:hypothetical protein
MIIEKYNSTFWIYKEEEEDLAIKLEINYKGNIYNVVNKSGTGFCFSNQKVGDLPFKILNLIIEAHQFAQQELNNYINQQKGEKENGNKQT